VKHHFIKEEQQNGFCIYCGEKIKSKLKSVLDPVSRIQYIFRKCNHCGKEERIKANFSSSGLSHDDLERIIN
jgi:hypothetical protein